MNIIVRANELKSIEDAINKIICGDALEVLKMFPSNYVDLIICDPPYFVLEPNRGNVTWDYFRGIDEYIDFSIKYLRELYRILKINRSLLLFWSEKHFLLFKSILEETKFKLHKIIIWHYPNVTKGFRSHMWINTFDPIFHLIKGYKPAVFNAVFSKEENKDVWIFPKPQRNYKRDKKVHPTQKPLGLIERMVKMFSNENELVLDPFIGSGTTAVACVKHNRRFIGIEINYEYCKLAEERIVSVMRNTSQSITMFLHNT